MADQWYVWREGQRYGPYTWEELVAYSRAGNVTSTDLVWSVSTDGWVRARLVPGLAPAPAPSSRRAAPSTTRPSRTRTILFAGGGIALVLLVGCLAVWFLVVTPPSGVETAAGSTIANDEVPREELEAFYEAIAVADDPDWQNYPDREAEEAAIAQTLDAFTEALKRGDVDGSAAHVLEERREGYRALFSSNPEAMASFADVITSGEMCFLSDDSGGQAFNRTAEYKIEWDGFTFYVVFMKVGERWVLYDF